jgi:hypothetical protein
MKSVQIIDSKDNFLLYNKTHDQVYFGDLKIDPFSIGEWYINNLYSSNDGKYYYHIILNDGENSHNSNNSQYLSFDKNTGTNDLKLSSEPCIWVINLSECNKKHHKSKCIYYPEKNGDKKFIWSIDNKALVTPDEHMAENFNFVNLDKLKNVKGDVDSKINDLNHNLQKVSESITTLGIILIIIAILFILYFIFLKKRN